MRGIFEHTPLQPLTHKLHDDHVAKISLSLLQAAGWYLNIEHGMSFSLRIKEGLFSFLLFLLSTPRSTVGL